MSKRKASFKIPVVMDQQLMVGAPTIAVVGAGPKAASIAAKAGVLLALGLSKVNVCIVESRRTAANWDGKNGFTNGEMPLGTNPEKDCGFPYDCRIFKDEETNAAVNERMLAFSWQAYNVANGTYSEWIDRGRLAPTHKQFASYLRWVIDRSGARRINGTVHRISPSKQNVSAKLFIEPHSQVNCLDRTEQELSCRDLRLQEINGLVAYPVDGVVLTGPGAPIPIRGADRFKTPAVLTGEDYWQHEREFVDLRDCTIGVFGGGETAATILLSLIKHTDNSCRIELVSASGLIYTRGEGFHENQIYSRPEKWKDIEELRRPQVIQHTDRGVFSVHAREQLDQCERLSVIKGYVDSIKPWECQIGAEIRWNAKLVQESMLRKYDRVVVARGFDAWHLPNKLLPDYFGELTNRRDLMHQIDEHLRMPVANSPMNLHVPALSGLTQGPGFMNLSCLGTLADRILSLYVNGSSAVVRSRIASVTE
jgi:mycobactin lysine-N-oxygenase